MKSIETRRLLILITALAGASCGRTSLLPDRCILTFTPMSLDFGAVAPGGSATQVVTVANGGAEVCLLTGIGMKPNSDAGFILAAGQASSLSVLPETSEIVSVSFAPQDVSVPLTRTGTLQFQSNDPKQASVEVPLTAKIKSSCVVSVSPAAVDFGHVMLGSSVTESVVVTDTGTGACQLADIALGSGSDSEFALGPGLSARLTLAPGASQALSVSFDATDAAAPHHRTGTLIFQSTDPNQPHVTVPLSADIDIGCDLTISPPSLAFGNVILNATENAAVTLGNDGSSTCQVSGIALAAGTDAGFALSQGQATSFAVAPGGSQSIPISFSAFDDTAPFLKTGTLIFQTGNPRAPDGVVPLSAYVNTACVEASQWIYTVDQDGMFSRFDPMTLTFTDIAPLNCPDASNPNSMAVDQNAVAWVAYSDGQLFQVDTGTAACTPTTFQVGQDGLTDFGMGFVFQPTTGIDTLYIAGGPDLSGTGSSTLATVAFPSLVVTPVGSVAAGMPELSGTGDGTLWGFVPDIASATGVTTLLQLDPTSGATLQSFAYPALSSVSGGDTNWAMKFWGGSFWLFLGQSVFQVQRTTPQTATTAIANSGRTIVGAGVSTCAPLH